VAHGEVRGSVPETLRGRGRSVPWPEALLRVLQHPQAAPEPELAHAAPGIFCTTGGVGGCSGRRRCCKSTGKWP